MKFLIMQFLYILVTFFSLGSDILINTLFSDIFRLTDQVLCLYKPGDKTIG